MNSSPETNTIKLIFGLGNPGEEYKATYHNAGFLALDWIVRQRGAAAPWRRRKRYDETRLENFVLAKSRSFMNESGGAVREALKTLSLPPPALLLIHDDSDLALGEARFSFGRGAAGHQGVQSVIDHLGTSDFWRLRLGIRPKAKIDGVGLPADPSSAASAKEEARRAKAGDFVLRPMSEDERAALYGALGGAIVKLTENVTTPGA
mgnify:CR=1 FL=1